MSWYNGISFSENPYRRSYVTSEDTWKTVQRIVDNRLRALRHWQFEARTPYFDFVKRNLREVLESYANMESGAERTRIRNLADISVAISSADGSGMREMYAAIGLDVP